MMGAGFTDHGFVFCLPDGRAYHPERVDGVRSAGVEVVTPRITLHALRHT